ncbi:MAG: carboxypeptidase-like regulatory domain-containing protein [Bacteroidota bacterium]
MRHYLFALCILFFTTSIFAQGGELKGTITDAVTGEGLIGATILVSKGKGTVTDISGNYSIKLDSGTYKVTVSYIGYLLKTTSVTMAGKEVSMNFQLDQIALDEVEVVADVAKSRETPVAFSNITTKQIQEELGTRDLPMILNTTPGVYATEQGGGSGDARVTIRGFSQNNIAVMVDGVPVNDMENGAVYWSNWDGLGDITKTMQVQRGLGASKIAINSVGGTINIITKGIDQEMSGSVKQEVNSFGLYKTSFGFNSGPLKGGWGVTVAGSRKWGNAWADGTYDDAWSYFIKVQKRFKKHLISLSANGAPQEHGMRTDKIGIAVYSEKFAKALGINTDSTYKKSPFTTSRTERGLTYNSNSGYLNGKVIDDKINYFHKPQINLSHFWSPNEKLTVSTVLYLSIGKGGGTGLKGTPARDTTTGQYDFDATYLSNAKNFSYAYSTTEHSSSTFLRSSNNDHIWYGLLSTWNYKINKNFSALLGLDGRNYKGSHYQTVYDLLGGDYAIDNSDLNQPTGLGNTNYGMKRNGDKISYYNDAKVMWGGAFGQIEFKKDKWSAFMTGSFSKTGYQRIDYFKKRDLVINGNTFEQAVGFGDTFYYTDSKQVTASSNAVITTNGDTTFIKNSGKPRDYVINPTTYNNQSAQARAATTKQKWFTGYTFKMGANYNITDHHNVFLNLGHLNMAPRMNVVFDNSNKEFLEIKNQKVYAIEAGYSTHFKKFAANLNLYYTNWENKPPQFTPTLVTPDGTFSYNINGLNAIHKGIELDAVYKFTKKLEVEGLASFGDWKTVTEKEVYVYDDNNELVGIVNFSAKNIHVGDAAQIQYGGSLRYEIIKGLYIKPRYTYFAKNYANFDPLVLTGVNANRESWKMPNYGLLDFYAGYDFKIKKVKFGITAGVLNVLNKIYITDAQNGKDFDANTALVYMGMGTRANIALRIGF